MYKTTFVYEALSAKPLHNLGLQDVLSYASTGAVSGSLLSEETKQLTQNEMAEALLSQGSGPSFLIGEDGWVYELSLGSVINLLYDLSVIKIAVGSAQHFTPDVDHVTITPMDVDLKLVFSYKELLARAKGPRATDTH